MVIVYILLSIANFSYLPVQANIGYSLNKPTIANLTASRLAITSDAFLIGVSLYGVEGFFNERREGKMLVGRDSLDLVIRYRTPFSWLVFTGETYPIKKFPLFIKIEGSAWANRERASWLEATRIAPDIWYEYFVYELQPSIYGKVSIGATPIRVINSDITLEIGCLYLKYPSIEEKNIKTSFSQFYISVGTKFLNKNSGDNLPWETAISTGIDATSIGIFGLSCADKDDNVKDWQLITLGSLGTLAGASSGWLQNFIKNKWLKPEDEGFSLLIKKVAVGLLSGTAYELTMIAGYSVVARNWPSGGDYMVRDLTYLFLVGIGGLGHLTTSIIF